MRSFSAVGVLAALAALLSVRNAAATTYNTIPQSGLTFGFVADETFATSTATRTAYATWDTDFLYVAFRGEQVINPPPGRRWFWYFDTDPQPNPLSGNGTASAMPFGTQNWTLPFRADYVFFANTGGGGALYRWDGQAWVQVLGSWWAVTVGPANPYVKVGIPRALLGSPERIYALGFIAYSEPGSETTLASWPDDSLVGGDGFQAAGVFAHWFAWTLGPGIAPNDPVYHDGTLPVELMGFSIE